MIVLTFKYLFVLWIEQNFLVIITKVEVEIRFTTTRVERWNFICR
jgi:hypothetical protein